jgi:hypothetical protein
LGNSSVIGPVVDRPGSQSSIGAQQQLLQQHLLQQFLDQGITNAMQQPGAALSCPAEEIGWAYLLSQCTNNLLPS